MTRTAKAGLLAVGILALPTPLLAGDLTAFDAAILAPIRPDLAQQKATDLLAIFDAAIQAPIQSTTTQISNAYLLAMFDEAIQGRPVGPRERTTSMVAANNLETFDDAVTAPITVGNSALAEGDDLLAAFDAAIQNRVSARYVRMALTEFHLSRFDQAIQAPIPAVGPVPMLVVGD